jgi:putative transposase
MLKESELFRLIQRLNLSTQAQQIIKEIRTSSPVRRVRSAAGNVSVRYPSRKMGFVIQAESHRNELAGIYEKEYDPEVLEYYDQPSRIKLVYEAKSGRMVGVWHTPDYFVIQRDSIGWEEWKTETELEHLVEKMPNRYVREKNSWHCPPGVEYAEQFGFFYQVRSSAEIDWCLQRNFLFLEDYFHGVAECIEERSVDEIITLVVENPGITLEELFFNVKISRDIVFAMVVQERIYIDLRTAPLAEPHRVRVFRDQETAQGYGLAVASLNANRNFVNTDSGSSVIWDGQNWTIVNYGDTQVTLLNFDGTLINLAKANFESLIKTGQVSNPDTSKVLGKNSAAVDELISGTSPADFEEANRRYRIISSRLAGYQVNEENIPDRTIRRWISRWNKAEACYGSGYLGLIPQRRNRGNHRPKLPSNVANIINEFIANDYETLKQKTKVAVYGALVKKCEEQEFKPPSYKTFIQAIQKRPRVEQVQKHQGKRAAYQHEVFYQELTPTTPRHGDRPFEIGHIDHTLLDIELVCSRTGRNLGRPWGTFLSDAFSRRLLAVTLAFDSPSYRSCMMVIRECVKQHGRFPQIIVVDGGREFESIYFETLLARYECSKKTRPGGKPRFGSVCERLFGTTNTRFIYNLLGNTQITRNVRQVTQAVLPKNLACWAFGQFYVRLCEWAYEVYDVIDHPALGQSPRDAFEMAIARSGKRSQRFVPYDENFRMFTLPTTRKGTAKILPHVGIKINFVYYWSDAFHSQEVEGTQVPVRYDPFDIGTAYAFVKGRWVCCLSEHYSRFSGRSEREIQLATSELRRRSQLHGQKFSVTARKLADFLASLEAEELLLEQRLKDFETKEVSCIPTAEVLSKEKKQGDKESVFAEEQIFEVSDDVFDVYEDY